ncbi:MAG: hypothetical protein CBC00_00745, partial [Verrucomicrobia bacterium TMED40]
MFQMYSKSLFVLHKFLPFSLLWVGTLLCGEPFLAPDDPFIRHEIRMLGDEGDILSLQNNWPLNLGALSEYTSGDKPNWRHSLLEDKIEVENNSGWSSIFSTIGFSDNRVTSRGFSPEPRSNFASNISTSWMNDRFAGKLSLNSFYGMETDWKGRKDESFALDGSYIAVRLGNWSASFSQQERWWGPGWDGSLILSTNARPIPGLSIDRRIPEPFETNWLSWIGPWSFHSFIGQMEDERAVPNPYLWGMRVDVRPTIIEGLEVGLFRTMQLGGDGYPSNFSVWVDAFLSQDNFHSHEAGKSSEPGNQLAGIDLRWKVFDLPFAFYGQMTGEDEENFLPEALFFQYGIETWKDWGGASSRLFLEYVNLTSYWWTGDPKTRNVTYNHGRYRDGFRYHGRPIGHWSDTDSQILSIGGL